MTGSFFYDLQICFYFCYLEQEQGKLNCRFGGEKNIMNWELNDKKYARLLNWKCETKLTFIQKWYKYKILTIIWIEPFSILLKVNKKSIEKNPGWNYQRVEMEK